MFDLTYLGNACFAIESGATAVLVDPYVSDNPECPYDLGEVLDIADFDAACVTHLADDHFGDCLALAAEHDLPVVTEPAAAEYLTRNGVPEDRVVTLIWGQEARIDDLRIRGLRAEHVSVGRVDGRFVSGQPLSFLFSGGGASVYHLGDTALFRDLELYGERYAPDAILIGVGQARVVEPGPTGIEERIYELTTDEAVAATGWLDPRWAVPMHYVGDEREAYVEALAESEPAVEAVPLDPGEVFEV